MGSNKTNITRARPYRYKRAIDLAILIVAHLVLLPLWVLLWTLIPLAIWLGDGGSIFFRQKRVGKDGKIFTILKFRTMVVNADLDGPNWTTEKDPRVTRIGSVLRRTALDELPELISIWKGEMSLVGPRALEVEEEIWLEEQIPGFAQRLSVNPGLTGLAQVFDRTDDAHTKFAYDLEYLERVSFRLDMKLLILSVFNTLAARWDQRSGKAKMQSLSPSSNDREKMLP